MGMTTVDLYKVIIYGPNGEPISSANKLEVNAEITIPPVTVDTTGLATSAGQATEATKLDTLHTDLGSLATQTTLAAVLAKIIAAPSTEATVAAILAKIIASPSTEAKQDTQITALGTLITQTDGVETSLTTLITQTDTVETGIGDVGDAAVITDANGSLTGKLRGLVKWAFERMPAALGGTTAANSFPVTLSIDGQFVTSTGALTEAAPANDTASSGLNGRLQRIAQNVTSLIAKFANDSTDRVRVSLYGKASAAGDTPALVSTAGRTASSIGGTNIVDSTTSAAGAMDTADTAKPLATAQFGFDGTSWNRQRNNSALTLLTTAARTVTTNSADQVNYNWKGCLITVDVTVIGTGSITPSIQVKDSISGVYITVWTAAAALTANGTKVYAFYPNNLTIGTLTYTELVNLLFGRTWRLAMVANNANSVTYSASADMVL